MLYEFMKWFLGVLTSTGLIVWFGYLMRDSLGRYVSKTIEHKFNKKLESFKSELREGERDIEQIRAYLSSARSSRDAALQSKKFDAAEKMIQARRYLLSFNVIIQYMQILNIDELLKRGDNPNVIEFLEGITKPLNLEQRSKDYHEMDKDTLKLYLSENTINVFEVYERIIFRAIAQLQILAIPLPNKPNLLKEGDLSKKIIEFIPSSKESFENHGENYVYYFADYFYSLILIELRKELVGVDSMARDLDSAEKLALDFQRTQLNVRTYLREHGLSEGLINSAAG